MNTGLSHFTFQNGSYADLQYWPRSVMDCGCVCTDMPGVQPDGDEAVHRLNADVLKNGPGQKKSNSGKKHKKA